MTAPPPSPTRDRKWQYAAGGAVAAVLFAFAVGIWHVGEQWVKHAEYSHGFLVVPFAAYLLWRRRAAMPDPGRWPDWWGVPFVAVAVAAYVFALKTNKAKETTEWLSFVLALAGVAVAFCGRWQGLRWAAVPLAFLLFATPLPFPVWQGITVALQKVATLASVPVFQTLGLATNVGGPRGTEINVAGTKLEVAEACGGLSMLLTFVALAAAIALLCPPTRPQADRWLIVLSSVPIALVCNVGRIVLTGLLRHWGFLDVYKVFVHDFAGWLMMLPALALIGLEFRLIDWLFVRVEYLSMEEVAKKAFATAKETADAPLPPPPPGRHPAAAFLPIDPTGTAHGATAAGGTIAGGSVDPAREGEA